MKKHDPLRRRLLMAVPAALIASACSRTAGPDKAAAADDDILAAMKRATRFMREHCTVNGGYVWSYASDFSRRWGEMEAFPTMVWIQPPGTATVGHLYLDCFHATGDEYFYESAAEVADSLIGAQHPAGGWNYLHDFGGPESESRWYDTIGRNGWRLEEFHHYYGNATFDDAGTSEASQFLLRMFLERSEKRFGDAVERALRFVLDSQYDNGGWPQRFPFVEDAPALHGLPDYTRHITFNDDVGGENIKFLLMAWQALGDDRARAAIDRAMAIFPATQQAAPQAAWGLQHEPGSLRPVGARSYEPEALVTHTTATNISLLLDFHEWTGKPEYLARVPEAFHWLESVRLSPDEVRMPGREFPTFIEIGSNRPLFNHRRGSNVVNGEYYHDYDPDNPIVHYSQWRAVDLDGLRKRYEQQAGASASALAAASPLLRREGFSLPKYFSTQRIDVSDLNAPDGAGQTGRPDRARVAELLRTLNADGYWPTPLTATSNPYIGDGSETPAPGDFSQTRVGDASDTSPYIAENPENGISTAQFIRNMSELMLAAAG